jgi:hypothetical protein
MAGSVQPLLSGALETIVLELADNATGWASRAAMVPSDKTVIRVKRGNMFGITIMG